LKTLESGTLHIPIGIAVQKNSVASDLRLALASGAGLDIVVILK
jgi:hypothetical protein